MSETGGGDTETRPPLIDRLAAMARSLRPESEGEKLKKHVLSKSSAKPELNQPNENAPSNTARNNAPREKRVAPVYKENRIAIKNKLQALDQQTHQKRLGIIRNATISTTEAVLIGDVPKVVPIEPKAKHPVPPPPQNIPISVVNNEPKPDIAPLQDEITPRIQAEQIKKA